MDFEKLIENAMTKYKSIDLYGLIEYAILMNENSHVKDIDIDIIKKIIKIIDKQLLYSDTDFLEDDNKELYDDISLELSEISSKDKEKIKEGLQYFISQYDSRKLIGERLHSTPIIDSTDRKSKIKEKQVYLEFTPKNKKLFKQLLIEKKQAKRTIYYRNGQTKTNYWNVRNFSMHSNLTANIKSSPLYKNAIENGIEKILFEIEDYNDSIIFGNEQKSNYTDIILTQSSNRNLFKEKENINFTVTKQRVLTPQTLSIEEEYKIGCEFYKEGLYEKTLRHFTNLAEQGYSLAQKSLTDTQYNLGNMYYFGNKGVKYNKQIEDLLESKKQKWGWLLVAKLLEEDYYLYDDFQNGGCNQNIKKAIQYYESAAAQNHSISQYMLGKIYYLGNGVEQNYITAVNYFKKSAENGNENASLLLGLIYYDGVDIQQDYSRAIEYFQAIAEKDNEYAQLYLGNMYLKGKGVEKDLVKAADYFEKAALQGNVEAENKIGYMYESGFGVEQNYSKAFEWYKKASTQCGTPKSRGEAEFHLGQLYYFGKGIEQDYDWAYWSYKRAIKEGYTEAQEYLTQLEHEMMEKGIDMNYSPSWGDLISQYSRNFKDLEEIPRYTWKFCFSSILNFDDLEEIVYSPNEKTNSVFIDINIYKREKIIFVIELQPEVHKNTESFLSRLKNSNIELGVLISDNLYIYCYNKANNDFLSLKIPFLKYNRDGIKFIELFNKRGFNLQKIKAFIKEHK